MCIRSECGHCKLGGICWLRWINHTDAARHTSTAIFGSVLCETKWLLLFLTVNTETKPQNKTVERITIDPHVSHAQSHLNGRLFLPEEPVQTFKSTDNARFSPLTLSFFPSLKLPCSNLMCYQLKPGGWEALPWPGSTSRSPSLFDCCYSSPRSLQFILCGSPNRWTKRVCPTSWSQDHHATHNSGRWHFLTPASLSIPNPISKAWVFLIYWWPHTLTLSLQLCRTAHWQD